MRAVPNVLPRSATGLTGAALVWTAGLAPSLLPRPPVIAIALAGLLWSVGYAIGALLGWVVRRLAGRRGPEQPGLVGLTVAGAAWAWAVVQTIRAAGWQDEQAQALGMAAAGVPWWLLLPAGIATGLALLLLGRALRALGRATGRAVARRGPAWLAVLVGVLVPVAVVAAVVVGGFAATKALFASINARPSGVAAPTSDLRSGGPGSLVPFGSLGAEGQQFVSGGPTTDQIAAYAGATAQEPIRVYAGIDSADTPQARADLAVQELQRTGAFDRSLLVVAMTTGNGFLDPDLVSAPELLTAGDIATVSTQYSVLPSWLSFVVDQRASQDEAVALWDAVRDAVAALPADARPQLAVSGESLGAFAGQAAFAGLTPEGVADDVDAAVWVGSPATSSLWAPWRDTRTAGPEWEPVIGDDTIARAPATAASTAWTQSGWGERRVVLTQHSNDPVAWWDLALLRQRPAWLDEPRGPGVDPRITWWPGVLFLQAGLDLAAAGSVPSGIGHNYADVTGQAWAYALDAPGSDGAWSPADTARLSRALHPS